MGRLFFLTEPRASVESSLHRVVDLSCSQHVLFGLEIHKSFDCFSLPGMSFQSDSFRAIPQPGFVIYISTIVWSPDFEERGNRFYPDWPHLLSPEIKETSSLCQKKKVHVGSLPHVCLGILLYTSLFVNFIRSCVIFLKYPSTSCPPSSWFFVQVTLVKLKYWGGGSSSWMVVVPQVLADQWPSYLLWALNVVYDIWWLSKKKYQ